MARFSPDMLELPIVQAPLAGGASTPALAAAVSEAGGLGFLAAGYKTPAAVLADVEALRGLSGRPFGLNVFAPPAAVADAAAVERYASALRREAERYAALGDPRHDDDAWEEKLAIAADMRPAVVSFTFGCPAPDVIARVQAGGSAAWVTVTTPEEAQAAARAGADALVVQGVEAGGHRGSFDDAAPGDIGLLALLQLVRAAVDLPLVAAGGVGPRRAGPPRPGAGGGGAALGGALMAGPGGGGGAPRRG